MLYNFQGMFNARRNVRTIIIFQIRKTYIIIGEAIDFDFEVEKNAFAGYFSCGAWVNGEYHIDRQIN